MQLKRNAKYQRMKVKKRDENSCCIEYVCWRSVCFMDLCVCFSYIAKGILIFLPIFAALRKYHTLWTTNNGYSSAVG